MAADDREVQRAAQLEVHRQLARNFAEEVANLNERIRKGFNRGLVTGMGDVPMDVYPVFGKLRDCELRLRAVAGGDDD